MTETHLLGDLPVGLALALGAYRAAERITYREDAGESRGRMTTALRALEAGLLTTEPTVFVEGRLPDLASIAAEWTSDDRWRFMVELRCSNPFYPYQFEMRSERSKSRDAALRELGHATLRLPLEASDEIGTAWNEVLGKERGYLRSDAWRRKSADPKTWAIALGAGIALAGTTVAFAPAIAVLMPAAAGLSGAAAVSAGLAQLGFGSIAAGGLGMVGGMWVLGTAGAAAGAVTATTTQLLTQPGSAHLVGVEVRKLLVTYSLARSQRLEHGTEIVADGLDTMIDEVQALVELEETRNEKGCARLTELYELQRTLDFAGEFMRQGYRAG